MSESKRKYTPKLFMLTDAQAAFIVAEAERRDPARYGTRGVTRSQSPVMRDIVDFAIAFHPLFLHFVANRGESTASGND